MPLFKSSNFHLKNGQLLPELEVAYETYGELNSDKSNAILVMHGTTSTHIAAGEVTIDRRKGWWDEVIGPGKLFDTDRYCIISSNILGSSYGTTGPRSINPATGRRYGPNFPRITFEDIVGVQHQLIQSLGIERLLACAGQAIGGLQAFQWAVTYPNFMAGVIATDAGPKNHFGTAASLPELTKALSRHPNWNDGDYYGSDGVDDALTELRIQTLRSYGFKEKLGILDHDEYEALLLETAQQWAQEFDANSMITLMHALLDYDVEDELGKVRAKFFYVLADTDELYPSQIGTEVVAKLKAAGVDATFLEVKSHLGHYATTEEPEKWVPMARAFLQELESS